MRETHPLPRLIAALAGVLVLLATVALAAVTARPTEATWQDTVQGAATFGTHPETGNNFARAIASYGTMHRWISGNEQRGPRISEAVSTSANPYSANNEATVRSPFGTAVLPLRTKDKTCARATRAAASCAPESGPESPRPTSHAVSELHSFDVHALRVLGIPTSELISYDETTPIRATASCRPGTDGDASLTTGGAIMLGDRLLTEGVPLEVPASPGASEAEREWGAYDYTARLFHDRETSRNHAVSQLRLVVETNAWNDDGERWALNLILVRAECGIAMPMPPLMPRPAADDAPKAGRSAPGALTTLVEQTADEATIAEDADLTELPSEQLTEVADPIGGAGDETTLTDEMRDQSSIAEDATTDGPTAPEVEDTSTPTTTASATPATSTSEPTTTRPTPTTEPETTAVETSAAPEGPQQPREVLLGQNVDVVTRDGIDLGTARIEDIERTPECGIELTLTITTSDEAGPDRWAATGSRDIHEVRADGVTRAARSASPECSAGPDTTPLAPGSVHRVVIAVRVSDATERAMLRPPGTAGWTVDLPLLPA